MLRRSDLQAAVGLMSVLWLQNCCLRGEAYSAFTCIQSPPWPVTVDDNSNAQKVFSNWLRSMQNDDTKCKAGQVMRKSLHGAGIGNSFVASSAELLKMLELSTIYRPTVGWMWADSPQNCSLGLSEIDCFAEPMSYCGYEQYVKEEDVRFKPENRFIGTTLIERVARFNRTEAQQYSANGLDICNMGRISKKPIIWVFGQILYYLMRPRQDVMRRIQDRFDKVFPGERIGHPATVGQVLDRGITIGVHVRGGKPDNQREPLHMEDVMHQVDVTVARLALRGDVVKRVFLCSDTQDTNIVSAEYMAEKFTRNFSYIVLPHLNYSVGTEAEYAMAADLKKPGQHSLSKVDIYAEFLADIYILAHSDVLQGSDSNVYVMAAALRFGRYPEKPAIDSGYLDSLRRPPIYMSEGLKTNMGTPLFRDRVRGFDGGTMFW
jgi:hypothetical protein